MVHCRLFGFEDDAGGSLTCGDGRPWRRQGNEASLEEVCLMDLLDWRNHVRLCHYFLLKISSNSFILYFSNWKAVLFWPSYFMYNTIFIFFLLYWYLLNDRAFLGEIGWLVAKDIDNKMHQQEIGAKHHYNDVKSECLVFSKQFLINLLLNT